MKRNVGFELCEKPRCKKVKQYKGHIFALVQSNPQAEMSYLLVYNKFLKSLFKYISVVICEYIKVVIYGYIGSHT